MARTKIDPAVSRKAYSVATAALKERYSAEFMTLLDLAYTEQGVESPRQRQARKAEEAAAAREAAAEKRAAAKQAKIEAAKALLEEAGLTVSE